MKKNESVTNIMTANPVCVEQNESVSSARHLINEKAVHHLPVLKGDKLVGMLTSNDLLRVSFGEFGNQDGRSLDAVLDHTYELSDLMISNPVTIDSTSTVREAARMLAMSDFHSLPVVDGDTLIGIVTSSDLITYLVDQY